MKMAQLLNQLAVHWAIEPLVIYTSIKVPEVNRNQFAYSWFLHGNTVDNVHSAHGHFVVGHNDELWIFAEPADHIGELTYVGIIQRRIYLIQNTKGRWFNKINCKQQGSSGECFLSTA